jgi:hypothetical protein
MNVHAIPLPMQVPDSASEAKKPQTKSGENSAGFNSRRAATGENQVEVKFMSSLRIVT